MAGFTRVRRLMGTVVSIDVRDDRPSGEIDSAIAAAFDRIADIEARFSTFRRDSEISRIGRGELAETAASEEVRWVLARCEELRLETDGAFDHRPTGGRVALDPAGFVKGWAADEAGAVLAQRDFEHWAINAGGDVLARGGITDAEPWKVGVRHPGQADQVVLVLEAPTLAVATSATYERGEHLWDSRDGSRPAHYRSVTVIGAELAYADAYTKPVWVRGPDGVAWVESQGYEVAIATWDDRLLTTVGVERFRSS